jgi:hypothetical protein
MDSKEEEFYYRPEREGRCINCGARIAVIDGKRTACDCSGQTRSDTPQEAAFRSWFESEAQKPRPDSSKWGGVRK